MENAPAKEGSHPSVIRHGFGELDRLLRGELTGPRALERNTIDIDPARLSLVVIALGMVSGACIGTFALFSARGAHFMQVVASMVKVPALFYLTLLVTIPSLYVFNALVGSRLTLVAVIRLLVATLAVIVAVLASLGPIVAFFSVSTTSYPFIVLFNVLVFGVSGVLGMLFLLQTLHRLSLAGPVAAPEHESPPGSEAQAQRDQGERPAGALDRVNEQALSRHVKTIFRVWIVIFGLVGAQMGWVLRPFVGNPNLPFTWLRARESNFFQAVFQTLQNLFS
jgi:hypothetical protein